MHLCTRLIRMLYAAMIPAATATPTPQKGKKKETHVVKVYVIRLKFAAHVFPLM